MLLRQQRDEQVVSCCGVLDNDRLFKAENGVPFAIVNIDKGSLAFMPKRDFILRKGQPPFSLLGCEVGVPPFRACLA